MFKIKAPDGRNNLCGKKFYELRKVQKLSLRQLAAKIQLLGYDVEHHFIPLAENGERFITDLDLVIFARALNVSSEKLLSLDDVDFKLCSQLR